MQPIQAFHLATIVLRIKAREAELKKLFEVKCKDYLEKLEAGVFDKWAMPDSKTDEEAEAALVTSPPLAATPTATGATTPLISVPEVSETESQEGSHASEDPSEDSQELSDEHSEVRSEQSSEGQSKEYSEDSGSEYNFRGSY